jgi:hypothetical protein
MCAVLLPPGVNPIAVKYKGISWPVFTHGPGPRGGILKKIEIEVWYAEKKCCPRERNLREIY